MVFGKPGRDGARPHEDHLTYRKTRIEGISIKSRFYRPTGKPFNHLTKQPGPNN